jgi:hypothetical protein
MPDERRGSDDPSWLNLVHKSAGVDGVEGLSDVVGDGVGYGDDVLAGLDLNGAQRRRVRTNFLIDQ